MSHGEGVVLIAERVALRDGGHVLIRPLHAQDRPRIVALLTGLSSESQAQRFHSVAPVITPAVIGLATAGHALVATRDGHVVALASYHPQRDPALAEMAVVVADIEQRRGIGTALCRRLVHDARRAGIRRLQADVAGSNRAMLALLRALGCPMTRAWAAGVIAVRVELVPWSATSEEGNPRSPPACSRPRGCTGTRTSWWDAD